MTRYLTENEKEWLVDWIKPNLAIPKACNDTHIQNIKNGLMEQFSSTKIYPQQLQKFKDNIIRVYYTSRISAGESIGIMCAQSIGEKQTQSALNSFHHIGVTAKLVTTGTPRINELLNITKNPHEKTTFVYFKTQYPSIQTLRNKLGSSFVELTLKDISLNNGILKDINEVPPRWENAWKILKNHTPAEETPLACLEYNINVEKLHRFSLTLEQIANILNNLYITIYVIPSPILIHTLRVYITPIEAEDGWLLKYKNILNKTTLVGIPGITDIYYTKQSGSWGIETDGANLPTILGHPLVNPMTTYSNYIWEIHETLGIEAARTYLIEEFMTLMNGINYSHVKVLCDRMTWSGSLDSISRYTMRNDQNPLLRCSFEECMHNFVSAATQCELDNAQGLSSSIILGKTAKVGTGFFDLSINTDKFII